MALALRLPGVHPLGNIRGLFREQIREKDGIRMENVVVLPVAVPDLPNGLAGDFSGSITALVVSSPAMMTILLFTNVSHATRLVLS